jgi:hypothetical protein
MGVVVTRSNNKTLSHNYTGVKRRIKRAKTNSEYNRKLNTDKTNCSINYSVAKGALDF